MSASHPEEEDVDKSYREAFSGLFGSEPTDAAKSAEGAEGGETKPSDSGPVKFADTADAAIEAAAEPVAEQAATEEAASEEPSGDETSGDETSGDPGNEVTGALAGGSWLDLEAGDDEGGGERTASLSRDTENEVPLRTFLDDAGSRNSRASFQIDPDMVDPDLPALPPAMFVPGEGASEPAGETREMPAAKHEDDLGHGGDETTRAMSESDVDEVLRDMESRVRELHAASPHDTSEDLVLSRPITPNVAAGVDAPADGPPASTAKLLETWIKKNAAQGVHFEPVGVIEPARPSVRLGAALEIGKTHLRYLELQPYQSGRMVATRFEQVALAEGSGASLDERLPRITAALAALRQRLGDRMATCTVLHEQGAIATRVLTLPVGTRHVDAAVKGSLPSSEPLVSAKRVMGTVRVGTDSMKSVLVSYAPQAELERIERALAETRTPRGKISSAQVSFLETVVPAAARLDEDAAEAFVLIERASITVALAARAVLLMARTIPLAKEPGSEAWVEEALSVLRRESNDLERACGGGELARVRYAVALPQGVEFPTKEIVVAFGRPAEMIDTELLFKIDLDSVKQLGIPGDAVASLAPAAFEATLAPGPALDLGGGEGSPLAIRASWALVGALVAVTLWLGFAWDPGAAVHEERDGEVRVLESMVDGFARVKDESAAAKAARATRATLDSERATLDAFAAKAPDVAAVLTGLAPLRPDGVFFERFHSVRAERARGTWELELTAIGTGDKDKGAALGGELLLRLRQTALSAIASKPGQGSLPDEHALTIEAKAGGVR